MGLADWFQLPSMEERKKQSLAYQKEIFPLGLAQRDLALERLRQAVNPRIQVYELLYSFIVAKQKYLEAETDAVQTAREYLKKRKLFSEKEVNWILALILLDTRVTSLEAYPQTGDIEQKTKDEFVSWNHMTSDC